MLVTFLVRFSAIPEYKLCRFYSTISDAFNLAYSLEKNDCVIDYKCIQDDYIVDTVPGTGYKPQKMVQKFEYGRSIHDIY